MSSSEQTPNPENQPTSQEARLLEANPEVSNAHKLNVDSEEGLKFDALGPVVVNSDGVRAN